MTLTPEQPRILIIEHRTHDITQHLGQALNDTRTALDAQRPPRRAATSGRQHPPR